MAEIKKINGNTLCDDVARDAAQAAMEKAGVQADWNEPDPESPAYIKNRIGGYKRSEEERKVVYDEYNAEIWDMAIDGDIIRYRKVSDTLLSVSDWIGAEIVIAGRDADGVEQDIAVLVICATEEEANALPADRQPLLINSYKDELGTMHEIWYDNATPCGIILPEDVVVDAPEPQALTGSARDSTDNTITYPKGVWALDLPWFCEMMVGGGGGEPSSLANMRGVGSNFMPVTMYHKSITLAEKKLIDGELVELHKVWNGIDSAQSTANSAQSTANSAQSTANSAQSTANSAQSTANSARNVAREANVKADGDYIGNKIVGETEYVIPYGNLFSVIKRDDGGETYTVAYTNADELDVGKRYRVKYILGGLDSVVGVSQRQDIVFGETIVETNVVAVKIKWRSGMTVNKDKTFYVSAKKIYTEAGTIVYDLLDFFLKYNDEETIKKKLPVNFAPYTAGPGIAISDEGVISATGEWAGKKWAAVGDSLTAVNASQSAKYYHQYIADKTGIAVENMGYGGSGYKKNDDESKAFYQLITSVPTDTNVVTIFGSGNDISYITDGGEWDTVTPTWTAGKYLRADNSGEVVDYSDNNAWVVSDLIAVNPGDTLKFTAGIKFAKSVLVFYTSEQVHVSHIASSVQEEYIFTDEVVTVPATAAYMRVGNVNTITTFSMMRKAANGLGTPTDTGTDTLCGCINETIDNLYATLPTVQLGLITPTPWSGYNPADTGNKMEIYANAIVEICKLRGIPCLDLYHCSALRPWDEDFRNAAYSKSGDGVHPDETGHAIIAPRIKAFMETLIL